MWKIKKTGFTLVEIVVAITIFTVGLLAVMVLFPQGARVLHRQEQDRVTAMQAFFVLRDAQDKGKMYFDDHVLARFSFVEPALRKEGLFEQSITEEGERSLQDLSVSHYELTFSSLSGRTLHQANVRMIDDASSQPDQQFQTLVRS